MFVFVGPGLYADLAMPAIPARVVGGGGGYAPFPCKPLPLSPLPYPLPSKPLPLSPLPYPLPSKPLPLSPPLSPLRRFPTRFSLCHPLIRPPSPIPYPLPSKPLPTASLCATPLIRRLHRRFPPCRVVLELGPFLFFPSYHRIRS